MACFEFDFSCPTLWQGPNPQANLFLPLNSQPCESAVKIIDANGQALTLNYDPLTNYLVLPVVTMPDGFTFYTNNVTNAVVRLHYVVDAAGNTNTITYTTNGYGPDLIHQVTDPHGRSVTFFYDDNGELTNMVDVAGISTTFVYDNQGWVTNMITPYGTNAFTYLNSVYDQNSESGVPRAGVVTEPNGSHQMCLFRLSNGTASGEDQAVLPSSYAGSNQVPANVPDGYFIGTNDLSADNSFYWGREQYTHLSSDPLATGSVSGFTNNDYYIARMRHWFSGSTGDETHELLMQRDPSLDYEGNDLGQMTWYCYPGSSSGFEGLAGNSFYPSLIIKALPDGSEWYHINRADEFGNYTNVVETYSVNGGVMTRTNAFEYSTNGVDLLQVVGPDGVTNAAYAYNGDHEVLFMTNALNEVTRYTYNTNGQTTSITQPDFLVTTNIYGADGFLSRQVVVGFSTNSYTYTNGLVYTHTDERGLTVTNSWDALQRLTNVAYPDGTSIAYTYNNLDLAKIVDRMGHPTSYGYNAIRQKVAETNALGKVTLYDYCDCGALYSITNALQQVTYLIHDNQGNLLQTIYPDGYAVTNTYNLIHQLVVRTDSSGLSIIVIRS